MFSSRSMIAGFAVALLVACHEPAYRESISDEQPVPNLPSAPTVSSNKHEMDRDPQSLVGRNWNTIRPTHCRGETLLRTTEPFRSYVIPTWRGRTLFVYREGGPIFETTYSASSRQLKDQRMRANLKILGVVDLGAFDWNTRVISGRNVVCWDRQDGGPSERGLVIGVLELKRVSHEAFPPERAWKWNEPEARFDAVADPSRVSCWFQEQGDTPLEAWRESWGSWGLPNFQCEIVTNPES